LKSERFFLRQFFAGLLILGLLMAFTPHHAQAVYVEMPEFLCELGVNFYKQGRYDEALMEFRKALLADPNYAPAFRYIQMVEQMKKQGTIRKQETVYSFGEYGVPESTLFLEKGQAFGYFDQQRDLLMERQLRTLGSQVLAPEGAPVAEKSAPPRMGSEKLFVPGVLALDESLQAIEQPVEIEQGKAIIFKGINIRRFLVTNSDVVYAEKISPDELLVTGKDIGFTFLHIWDVAGRWTVELAGIFPKLEEPSYEEMMLIDVERARNFKLRYTLDWASFESGRTIDSLRRTNYSWSHGLGLSGGTPYGDINSWARIRSSQENTDLSYLTFSLINGKFRQFEGFTLRGADYSLPFGNMALGSPTLRGVMFTSPVFNKKLEYTTFWGREGGGRYGDLSPSLAETRHSFLNGFHFNINPNPLQNYKFSLLHAWGRDAPADTNHYAYDFMAAWNLNHWRIDGEVAHDAENIASLAKVQYIGKRFSLNTAFRDIPVEFNSITGRAWRAGELGGTMVMNYRPTEKLSTSTSLNVYKDRAFPAEDNPDRFNEDLNWDLSYYRDPATTFTAGYTFQNYLGTLSQTRGQTLNLGVIRNFSLLKNLVTYANYYHQESKSYSSPAADMINDRVYLGIRFSLIGDLYYFANKEFNWLLQRYTGVRSYPHVFETGVSWANQLGNSPLFGDFRFSYRDEEDTGRGLSFLAGEDYIEGYLELSCRPTSGNEIYGSCRMRNIWAENPNVSKRFEMDFNAGMRYLWDTGLRYENVCNIEGYVFKDLNSDGLRQRNDPPISRVKVILGKDQSQITDEFGYYSFKKVKGLKAYVTLDASTLPSGYVLTVPFKQEIALAHGRNIRVDYGIISNSEIAGLIFEDTDFDGEYGLGDKGVSGVNVILEDGNIAVTDGSGRYSFLNAPTGAHILKLDLRSLPVYYIPATAITKNFTLKEGEAFLYNIPLKRISE
jgi:tetratricopeptide (TPR) repeat protein